ncbi:hypothetical protein H7I77_06345 [Mycolicibacterium novocastrense]|uniref:Uncharacterized protein n=1 Tax=Mycolicibacterium novocastrense TaxID=59813 RepID=A0AAW5SIS7_MYCNV|nr:hypothetical protein [Mycolicibacterium novocastrense]MCV7022972.1 hypothetical protein [Mycolicibacterium novocastrense]GAT10938.1 predicted protein [Mycolicibacterium novocastrense]
MSEIGTTEVGAHLVLSCPLNHHVGNLTQASPDAPDDLVFGQQPWGVYVEGENFVVECPDCGGGTKVYDNAQALKDELNAELAEYPEGSRVTHNLALWKGN